MKTFLSLLAAAAIGNAPAPAPASPLQGNWRNPKGTVEVRIGVCGAALCGTVVAASPVAAADARAAGYPALVGMQLMRRYVPAGPARWQGTVFVPDIGRSFSSHIDLVDADHARVSGCLFGQFLCRSQLWRRA